VAEEGSQIVGTRLPLDREMSSSILQHRRGL
jgi:hypothetical protein